jgi:hypothetical protein
MKAEGKLIKEPEAIELKEMGEPIKMRSDISPKKKKEIRDGSLILVMDQT